MPRILETAAISPIDGGHVTSYRKAMVPPLCFGSKDAEAMVSDSQLRRCLAENTTLAPKWTNHHQRDPPRNRIVCQNWCIPAIAGLL